MVIAEQIVDSLLQPEEPEAPISDIFRDPRKIALAKRIAKMDPDKRAELIRLAAPRIGEPYTRHIPHPPQQVFLSLNSKEAMYGGAAGGGKSDSLLMAALQYVDVPGYSALILRRTWPDLNAPGAILNRAQQWFAGTDARQREAGRIWEFPCGNGKKSTLQFGYIQYDKDKYKFQCFTPEHELLTVDGWKSVAEVTTDDMVASVNPVTRIMTYEHVDKSFAYDFDGELVDVFQQNGVSFKVTSNHTVWSGTEKDHRLRPVRADELPTTATIPQVFNWECADASGKSFETRSRGGHTFTPEQWLKFLGWYVSEGNCGSYGGRWEVKITQHKERGWNELRDDLAAVDGLHWKDYQHVTLNNKALVEWLIEHTGTTAHHKRLPEEVWNLDRKWADVLLRALVAGDGSTMTKNWCRFYTYSSQLADDVMRLAVHAGWRPTLDIRKGGNYKEGAVTHIVHLSRRTRDTGLQTARQNKPNSFWKSTAYKGKVYCVETHPHHTLVIRHRGRVSLSGNSAEYQFIGFDELTHFEDSIYHYMFSRCRRPAVSCLNCSGSVRRYRNKQGKVYWKHTETLGKQRCGKNIYPDPMVLDQYEPSLKDGLELFDVPLRVRSATNPGGIGHQWVKDHFVNEVTKAAGAIFVPARLQDNPSLDRKEYEESLQHLLPVDRERLLNGDWDVDVEGALFQRHWFNTVKESTKTGEVCRYWDLAATEGGDYTCGAKLRHTDDGRWQLEDMVRFRGKPHEVEKVVFATAVQDGIGVRIYMEEEPGSSGKNTISHYRRNILAGFTFNGKRSTGDKTTRAYPVASAAQAGNFDLIEGPWNRDFIDECSLFPGGANDDQCDAVSGALNVLAFGSRTKIIV